MSGIEHQLWSLFSFCYDEAILPRPKWIELRSHDVSDVLLDTKSIVTSFQYLKCLLRDRPILSKLSTFKQGATPCAVCFGQYMMGSMMWTPLDCYYPLPIQERSAKRRNIRLQGIAPYLLSNCSYACSFSLMIELQTDIINTVQQAR